MDNQNERQKRRKSIRKLKYIYRKCRYKFRRSMYKFRKNIYTYGENRQEKMDIKKKIMLIVAYSFILFSVVSLLTYSEGNGDPTTEDVALSILESEIEKAAAIQTEVILTYTPPIDPDKPMVALTFDDGPGKHTARLLDSLKEHQVKATFFMLGTKVTDKYANELQRMSAEGHELGNHSFDHPDLTKQSADYVQFQINETNNRIETLAGSKPTVMRPPYGATNQHVQELVGLPLVFWNVDTLDWKTKDVAETVKVLTTEITDGDIILLHDIHGTTVDAVIQALPILKEQGFQLVTVSELAEARGKELVAGEKYFRFRK